MVLDLNSNRLGQSSVSELILRVVVELKDET